MAKARLVWNGDQVRKRIEKLAIRNGNAALNFLVRDCKKKLSRGNVTGKKPSEPGEYPKKVTGVLMNAVDMEPMKVEGTKVRGRFGLRSGAASAYGPALEFGYTATRMSPGTDTAFGTIGGKVFTYDLAARPFLRPTAINGREKVKELMGRGFAAGGGS